jgi:hypothetical protein
MLQETKLNEIQIKLLALLPEEDKKKALILLLEFKSELIDLTFAHIDKQIETAKHFKNHIN